MEAKEQRKLEMRGVVAVVAVVLALMGFSATLATKDKPAPASAEMPQTVASSYEDPSLAGLRVADDAEVDATVEFHN